MITYRPSGYTYTHLFKRNGIVFVLKSKPTPVKAYCLVLFIFFFFIVPSRSFRYIRYRGNSITANISLLFEQCSSRVLSRIDPCVPEKKIRSNIIRVYHTCRVRLTTRFIGRIPHLNPVTKQYHNPCYARGKILTVKV